MKAFIGIFLAALIFCGCKPKVQQWEYEILEVDNFAHFEQQQAETEMLTNIDQAVSNINDAKQSAGEFHLDNAAQQDHYNTWLTKSGLQGWELVSAIPQTETMNGKDFKNVRTGKIILIFKRPIR
ncbi:MAG TPA: hypothetical protein VFY06_07325 [Verrucomicrobiae bacterium]|nr:hypothetical protein [Verrucomicrobiae bacterium]